MRIVGGDLRGRTLYPVPGRSTRPTADRVRQSLFDLLGQRCDGLRVLDLYAGTGALAFEALSRGAAHATLVEADAKAAKVIERNAAELGCADRCTLLREDVGRALRQPRQLHLRQPRQIQLRQPRQIQLHGPFNLVFSDPPYALRAAQPTLDSLAAAGLVAPGGRIVLERDRREPQPHPPDGFDLEDERRYGDTLVLVARRR